MWHCHRLSDATCTHILYNELTPHTHSHACTQVHIINMYIDVLLSTDMNVYMQDVLQLLCIVRVRGWPASKHLFHVYQRARMGNMIITRWGKLIDNSQFIIITIPITDVVTIHNLGLAVWWPQTKKLCQNRRWSGHSKRDFSFPSTARSSLRGPPISCIIALISVLLQKTVFLWATHRCFYTKKMH